MSVKEWCWLYAIVFAFLCLTYYIGFPMLDQIHENPPTWLER